MCQSCDKLRSRGVQIPPNPPDHQGVYLEGDIPVFESGKELVAWVEQKFVHAAFGDASWDGQPRLDGKVLHIDAYN